MIEKDDVGGRRPQGRITSLPTTADSDFDYRCDLVLIDLGYFDSIQQSLRRIFDIEGIEIHLHGLCLLSIDDAFNELSGDDP